MTKQERLAKMQAHYLEVMIRHYVRRYDEAVDFVDQLKEQGASPAEIVDFFPTPRSIVC